MSESETNSAASPRVARRRVETRARLLSVASRLFAQRSFAGVRLDEIADQADVARGTLYSHFDSKEELLRAIVQPVLERAVDCLQRIPETLPARQAVDELLRTYLGLWRLGPDAMRLAHRFEGAPPRSLFALHDVHVRHVVAILRRAAEAGLLRLGDPMLSARIFATTAVPVLEIVSGSAQAETLFLDAMGGLLLRPGLK
ncbi:MAG TPA: TetR/AcrR family transcriptional regulator [Myxococcales bacterium]|jgi:AcrR family transcriptional regulator